MRLLAIDIGGKRTGFAVGDTELSMVQPLEVVVHANEQELFEAIERVCGEHRPEEIVIGLPLNMDDSEGPAAKKMRLTADKVLAATGMPVHLHDERLTSFEANSRMARSGRTHAGKKKIRDAIAAATLLEDYLAGLG